MRDVRYIELLNRIEAGRKAGTPDTIFLAEILAHQGKYQEAAKVFLRASPAAGVVSRLAFDSSVNEEEETLSGGWTRCALSGAPCEKAKVRRAV